MIEGQSRKTILIVDDAPENLDLLAGILKTTYKVKVAKSGEYALKIIAIQCKENCSHTITKDKKLHEDSIRLLIPLLYLGLKILILQHFLSFARDRREKARKLLANGGDPSKHQKNKKDCIEGIG